MSNLANISSLSLEPFEILAAETENLKSRNFFSPSSLGDLTNNEQQSLSFMLSGGEFSHLGFGVIFWNDGASMEIISNIYDALNASRRETEIWKKIATRLIDLNIIFDEENHERKDNERYLSTSKLLVNVLKCFELKKYPFIGIDDNGQIGAEWHDGNDYKIISIIPRHNDNISVSCINKSGIMRHIETTLVQISSNGAKELSVPLEELPW